MEALKALKAFKLNATYTRKYEKKEIIFSFTAVIKRASGTRGDFVTPIKSFPINQENRGESVRNVAIARNYFCIYDVCVS